MFAKDFMTPKSQFVTCSPDENLQRVSKLFSEMGLSSILIEEKGEIKGIITKTDVIKGFIKNENLATTTASKFMKTEMEYCDLNYPRDQICDIMSRKKIHHLLVRDSDLNVVGLISTFDVIKNVSKLSQECPFLRDNWKVRSPKQFEEALRQEIDKLAQEYEKTVSI